MTGTGMYNHLLLPIDGSPTAQAAAQAGVALARRIGAHVTALHVVPEPSRVGLDAWAHDDSHFAAKMAQELESRGKRYTAQVREVARQAGVACECRVARGASPHAAILALARETHCDLIVMGSHGASGQPPLLGSETLKVMTLGTIPVLVHYGARGVHPHLVA